MGNVQIKGWLWGFLFLYTAFIVFSVPTKLIFTYWISLNEIVNDKGQAIYTYALFAVFGYVVMIIISAVYLTAAVRAFVQSSKPVDTPSFGISKGVKTVGIVISIIYTLFMIIWFLLFQQIAIYSLPLPP